MTLLLALAALAASAAAQNQASTQAILVSLDAATTRFDNAVVTRCFGSSHAATAMRGAGFSPFFLVWSHAFEW